MGYPIQSDDPNAVIAIIRAALDDCGITPTEEG